MATISMKYFYDHVSTSVFNNQKELADELGIFSKRNVLENSEINPLTVRLFKILEGLNNVKKVVNGLVPKDFSTWGDLNQFYHGTTAIFLLDAESAPSGSTEYYQTYKTDKSDWNIEQLEKADTEGYIFKENDFSEFVIEDKNNMVHTFPLHTGIYDFFANIDTAFDRLRLEINSIYFDGSKILDASSSGGNKYWSCYLNTTNSKIISLKTAGYIHIANILTGTLSIDIDNATSKYRHRLIHDGELELLVNRDLGKVFLPDDPINPNNFNTELLPFIEKLFDDIQTLFFNIYSQIVIDLKIANKVPII